MKKFSRIADGGIADAVDEDVVARVEAADEEAVAEGVAALAGAQRHAGGGARRFRAARSMFLSASTSLLSTVIGLRRVEHRLGKFAGGLHAVDLVGRGRVGVGIAVGGQAARIGERHGGDLRRLRAAGGATQRAAGAELVRRRF